MIRFATVAIAAGLVGACVPPLPGGSLDDGTGAGGMAGASSSGAGASPAGAAGFPASSGRAASPSNTGGVTGSGGSVPSAACTAKPIACTAQPMCPEPIWTGSAVSSFETDCNTVDAVDGRDGGWYVYTTANTTASPGPIEPFRATCPGAAGSCFANCVSGMLNGNGVDWPTAGIGFTPRANAAAYDVSRYSAIDFWLHASVGPASTLRLLVPLKADTMVGNGDGTCTTNCFDAYSTLLPTTPGWQHVSVPFAQLRQQGFGPPEAWDPTSVISVQWAVAATASPTQPPEPYVICVDQVQLLP